VSTASLSRPIPVAADGPVRLREVGPADAGQVARILFEAFAGIHDHHRFPRDFPARAHAEALVADFIAHPGIWGVVAERDGRILGSNFLDERAEVRGLGPITVAPAGQGLGVGRRLMEAAIARGAGARGIRLLQDAFNTRSLGLYASLGFEIVEPVAVMGGRPRAGAPEGVEVRPLVEADVPAAERLSLAALGFARTDELRDALAAPHMRPFIAIRDGRPVAYAAGLQFFPAAHGAAETEADMAALIAGGLAQVDGPASFLLPVRQGELFRWALDAGLRVVKPMTYMALGEPPAVRGAWFPSVLL
jgi:ribosomal protein S18 acetylase RimI-like enzyme